MKKTLRRILGLFLVVVTLVTMFVQPVGAAFSADAGRSTRVTAPELDFQIRYDETQGGNAGSDQTGQAVRQVLIGHNEENSAVFNLTANLNSALGNAENLYFDLWLPYFYRDANNNNAITPTYDIENVPEDQRGENLMYVAAKVTQADSSWKVSTSAEYQGKVRFESKLTVLQGTEATLPVRLYFKGPVPENTSCVVSLGGGYKTYTEGDETIDGTSLDANPDLNPSSYTKYVLICSNLKWTPKVEAVNPRNAIWDKYNYLVYKVSIENTSSDKDSHIKAMSFNMDVPDEGDQNGYGLHDCDAMKFKLNDDGSVSENSDYSMEARENYYVGMPGQGGVMIYDVTGISSETLSEWNLVTFNNAVDDDGNTLSPIKYTYTSNSNIYFNYSGNVYGSAAYEGGTDEAGNPVDTHKEFYVAFPMSTDIPEGKTEMIPLFIYDTVSFGNNGEFYWTKTSNHQTHGFDEAVKGFTHRKYVLNSDAEISQKATASLGDEVSYYLDNFKNTGNIPAFNANAVDTHHKFFELTRITAFMNFGEKDPVLADWFKEEGTVELEFRNSEDADETQFVPIGSLSFDSARSEAGKVNAYSLEVGNSVQNQIDRLNDETGKTWEYTNRVKINFKERIAPDEAFNGRIAVTGVVNKAVVYDNELVTNYERWQWISKTLVSPEEGYYKEPNALEASTAVIDTMPANPIINTDIYRPVSGVNQYGDPYAIPVNVPGVGFRYRLANDSISKLIPGSLSTGILLDKNEKKPLGFITEKIILSKKLIDDIAEVKSVTLYGFNKKTTPIEIPFSSFVQDENGNYYLPSSFWSANGELYQAKINFKSFAANVKLSNDVYVALSGHTNIVKNAENPLVVTGSFKTEYEDEDFNKTVSDPATMTVTTINPVITGFSFDENGKESAVNSANASAAQSVINSIETANIREDVGYEFLIGNAAVAPSGSADIMIDLSSSVGDKTPGDDNESNPKGYKTKKIIISDYTGVADISEIKLWNWDKNPDTQEPDVIIPFEDVTIEDGKIVVDISKYPTIEYLRNVALELDEFYGSEDTANPNKMNIRLEGLSDWFGNLDAKITYTPDNGSMHDRIITLTDRLLVQRPTASLHANVHYYGLKATSAGASVSTNTDGNKMTLGVPYDRDFYYRVTIGNDYISQLDDLDLVFNIPINNSKAGNEAYTGFHTTGIEITKNLIDSFKTLETLTFYDADDLDKPENATEVVFDKVNGTITLKDGGTPISVINEKGSIYIDEQTIFEEWGIEHLARVKITGKEFAPSVNDANSYIDFHGFSDSLFNSFNEFKVSATNYLAGLRANPANRVISNDTASAYISKMYFDSTIVAGFKNKSSASSGSTEGTAKAENRFDAVSTSAEHMRIHRSGPGDNYYWNDNSELDIGYKAVGSYMFDFRQYHQVGGTFPNLYPNPAYSNNTIISAQEHQGLAYVHPESMNTAADVEMTVNLPQNSFEAYYLKIHPLAKDYLEKVTVIRANGEETVIDKSEWQSNSVETAYDAGGTALEQFFRIDLAKTAENEDAGIYKAPKDYAAENPVKSVVITLNINREDSDGSGNAKSSDFGSWFDAANEKSKYMFEVTGRFYKAGAANATLDTDISVGGFKERPYAQAKERTENSKASKSDWSYWNNYLYYYWRDYYGWTSNQARYDSSDLHSTAKVYVCQENNSTLSGVHKDPNTDSDLNVTFGMYNEYAVSFYQTAQGADHDYLTGAGSPWYKQDRFDWSGKHAYTDKVVLTDTMPVIRPDSDSEYYGFLSKAIYISPKLYPFIDYIDVTKKTVTENENGTYTEAEVSEKLKISKDDLALMSKAVPITNPNVGGNDEGVFHDGFYEIPIIYSGDEQPEITDGKIILAENEFVKSYRIYMKDLGGDGDYASEFKDMDLVTSSQHDNNVTPDVYVGGDVYRVRETNPPAVDRNTMSVSSYVQNSNTAYKTNSDNALLMGYRIPFQAGYYLNAVTNNHIIYDYQTTAGDKQNVDPNYGKFELRVWNRADTDQEAGRTAFIDSATITSTMNENYRLKHINIPAEFIEGDWFKLSYLTLNYGASKKVTYSFNQLLNDSAVSKYFSKQDDEYVFDVNLFIIDHIGDFSTFNANNYETGDVYVTERISSFIINLSAVDKRKLPNGSGTLMGGEYLNAERQSFVGDDAVARADALPTFTYDGVYADRTKEDVLKNVWTKKSRPTIRNGADEYTQFPNVSDASNERYNNVAISFTSADRNAETYKNLSGIQNRDYFRIYNIAANMNINMQRLTDISAGSTFAYDFDYNGTANEELAVDRNHLLPNDYIEYKLSVGTSANSIIPVYHPDLRLVAPAGQRIIGWYVKSNNSDIPSEDFTATLSNTTSGSNAAIDRAEVDRDKNYSLVTDADGVSTKTNYKRIDISLGDLSKAEELNQLKQGETIEIVVVTQLTNELNPFEGKTINANYYAAARPQHTYSQYKIKNGSNTQSNGYVSSSNGYYYYSDTSEKADYYRYGVTSFYGDLNSESTYMSDVRSNTTFYDSRNLIITSSYDDAEFHYDGMPVTVKITGANGSTACDVENDTLHTLETAVYTVSFLSTSNSKYYKGFDLTEKPVFPNPAPMAAGNAAVEYCYYGDIETLLGGIYTADDVQNEYWLPENKVVEGDTLTDEQIADGFRLVKDAVKIRWTYKNVPAYNGTDPVKFATVANPFTLHGVGRYRDIRTDAQKTNTAVNDVYTMNYRADVVLTHKHDEVIENTTVADGVSENKQFTEKAALVGSGSSTKTIVRERPILNIHTQIFANEGEAAAAYNASAAQKLGYRPGETVWFKTTVQNLQKSADASQGVLLNPVIFDKIPEYITVEALEKAVAGDNSDIRLVWYNRDGSVKADSEIPAFTVTRTEFSDIPDYGGDMVTTKADNDGSSMGTGHAFVDINLASNGNTVSTPINFNLYKFEFADGTRFEIGEHIEFHYSANIRLGNLPLSYTQRGTGDSAKTFVDYYPKMGEYYQVAAGHTNDYWGNFSHFNTASYPYIGVMNGLVQNSGNRSSMNNYMGSFTRFLNNSNMMDMNYLYHDVGVSGTRNKNIDKFDYLKDSNSYIPGYSGDENSNGVNNYGGSNGYLKDYDINVAKNQQITKYVPTLTANKLNELPVSEQLVSTDSGRARDWYTYLMAYRNRSTNWQQDHEDAVLWAEARIHMQTAWLATSSQMIGSDQSSSIKYLPTVYNNQSLDPQYNLYWPTYANGSHSVWGYNTASNAYTKLFNDDSITTLEFDQNFVSRISAYNYGDWDLTSGIEFTYIMPQGIEPRLNADGSINVSEIKAQIMSGGTSNSPSYTEIPSDKIKVEVIQEPGDADISYLTPNVMQDPILSTSTMNRSGDSYENKDLYYSADEKQSWVLKITVDYSLKKWFNRGTDSGYMMYVDIPSHVYRTPEDEYWYDEVLVKPADTSDTNSLYYQVYDETTIWGNNHLTTMPNASRVSTQYGGMDYIWNSYFYRWSSADSGPNGNMYYVNGSPNMPYINGMNISNREVSSQGVLADSGRDTFASGIRNTYASTGTRAYIRKPLIRTWTTVGQNNLDGKNAHGYYFDPQGDTSTLNIHVENKYWLNTLAPDQHYYGYNNNAYREYSAMYKVKHTYSTDGGNKGTLFYPVVTNILPAGIIPKDINGELFTEDNEQNALRQLDWSLYGFEYSGNAASDYKEAADEKELYSASVKYITLDREDGGTEGRYQITFMQKSSDLSAENMDKLKIDSESGKVFSFKFYTRKAPDGSTKSGEINHDLLDQYQKNHTFVSSQLENFKFLIDSETNNFATENPYYVGNRKVTNYNGWQHTYCPTNQTLEDARLDIAGAILPDVPTTQNGLGTASAIDATDELGNKRYFEEDGKVIIRDNADKSKLDELQMEDYTDLRYGLTLKEQDVDFDGGNDTSNIGVHTTNRIRVKYPDIENQSFVTAELPETLETLGTRSEDGLNENYTYYPDNNDKLKTVQYGDNLYYSIKASNGAVPEDHLHHGNVQHGKIRFVTVLPTIAKFLTPDKDKDSLYIMYKQADGSFERVSFDELKAAGYNIDLQVSRTADNKHEVVSCEITTPGSYHFDTSDESVSEADLPSFAKYVSGDHLPGYFDYQDTLVLSLKTVINRTEEADSILTGEQYWDNGYKADTYVTLEDIDGNYLKEMYPDGNFSEFSDCDEDKIVYIRPIDYSDDLGFEYDADKEYKIQFARDISGAVTVRKPHSTVRIDTSENRLEIINPDLYGGTTRVVEDPSVKGATKMSVYIDEAVNDGAAVSEYILDYRIPFRGTNEGTLEEADASNPGVKPHIYAIGTGKWEIPESAGSAEYIEELKEHLRVQIIALYSDCENAPYGDFDHNYDPLRPGEISDLSYENVNQYADGSFASDHMHAINLTEIYNQSVNGTNDKGVPIDSNTIIDIDALSDISEGMGLIKALDERIYQLRFLVSSDDPAYLVPNGFRMDIDADETADGKQEMSDIDPDHENLNPLPDSVTSEFTANHTLAPTVTKLGNAAFIMANISHEQPNKKHINHFVNAWSKYDDFNYGVIADRSRAGYYVSREMPVLEVDLQTKYFKYKAENVYDENGDPVKDEYGDDVLKYYYSWDNDTMITASSSMLKYTASIENFSDNRITDENIQNITEDTATNVQISAVVPFIQDIDMSLDPDADPTSPDYAGPYKNYKYCDYKSLQWMNTLDDSLEREDPLRANTACWTWHLEDADGNWIANNGEITNVTLKMYDKVTDIASEQQRRVMTWTADGILEAGQKIIIDFMLPISTSNAGVAGSGLLNCKAYAFKPGAFIPFIPTTESGGKETYAYELDKRDINDNGMMNSENTISKTVSGLSFSFTSAFNRPKVSFSEYGTGLNSLGNDSSRPSLVPEGTEYSFESSLLNPGASSGGVSGFQQPIIYDVLPYKNDVSSILNSGEAIRRGSDWRGFLNLDSIKVKSVSGDGITTDMTDGRDVNIWIGPFNYSGSSIKAIPVENLPSPEQTSKKDFYVSILGNGAAAVREKQKYFVRLADLLKLKTTNRALYDALEREAQAIYAEPSDNYVLSSRTKFSLSYSLRAPLNIPMYPDYIAEDDPELKTKVSGYDGWNNFVGQYGENAPLSSSDAGVYLATPADKGYIGHYVWLDENYSGTFTDDGDYIKQGGRWILNEATKDLDYDGEIDDPGINGVKVELLSENGYPVNRLGEPVAEILENGMVRYCLVDESTGELVYDSTNHPSYLVYGPEYYITEKDVNGHDGYFVMSNLAPGNYKLRYTFPNTGDYDEYALTTRAIGVSESPMTVYRSGDKLPDLGDKGTGVVPSDAAVVDTLVIQTDEAIRVDAIGNDPDTYEAYDEKMTSYDLGVAPSFSYGGYAWREIDINGLKDANESGRPDTHIAIYEVTENPNATGDDDKYEYHYAYDADGNQISGNYTPPGEQASDRNITLRTDANGYFKTTLYPYRSYIAVAYTYYDSIVPSPITKSTYPLRFELDNDLTYNESLDRFTTAVFAVEPKSADYPMNDIHNGQYGTYDRLGFAFVSTDLGSIGKYVFHDENYDGIRNEYINSDGYVITEPGVNGVKLVLEKYYYDYNTGKWVLLDDNADTQISEGSAYTFLIDHSGLYHMIDGTRYACGYKVKMDMDSVDEVSAKTKLDFVPTKFYMNNGISDSDLPVVKGENEKYRYLSSQPVVAAEIVDSANINPDNPYQFTIDGVTYDTARGRSVSNIDAGLATVDTAHIKGAVWNDKNYDGIRNTYTDADNNEIEENGVGGVELQLIPYVYYKGSHGTFRWNALAKDDLADPSLYNDYIIKTKTDASGTYDFGGVRTTAVLNASYNDQLCITGYKIKIISDIADMGYGITKYLTNSKTDDSELWISADGTMLLNEPDDYIVTAKKISNEAIPVEYGDASLHNQSELVIYNSIGNFDVNKASDYEGNDAGLTEFKTDSISGRVFVDSDYDGVMDDIELGLHDLQLTLKRYYLESGGENPDDGIGTWVEDTAYKSPTVKTDDEGNYTFENLPAQVYKNGNYYLAGYKAFVVKHPDVSQYAVTLYKQYGKAERGSNLKGLEIIKDDQYMVVSDTCGKYNPADIAASDSAAAAPYKNLSHVVKYQGDYYDVVTTKPINEIDAGYSEYRQSVITGSVFDDINYDGIINGDDGFTDELKAAIDSSLSKGIEVTATGYYYDHNAKEWKLYKPAGEGSKATFKGTVTTDSENGVYQVKVPTKFTVDGVNYLAGFRLTVNLIPPTYHITKHLANGDEPNDNALIKFSSSDYVITKTIPGNAYVGKLMEEIDGYVISAKPSDHAASANLLSGYDIADVRTVSQYNIGYTAKQMSTIDGYIYKDNNCNGKYDFAEPDEPLQGIKVGLKRYQWNQKDNTWSLDHPDDAEYYKTIETGLNGRYTFHDLPTHAEHGDHSDVPVLYGYTVWLLEMPQDENGRPLAATYYQLNHERYDSALLADSMQIIKNDKGFVDFGEFKDGYTIIAQKLENTDPSLSDIVDNYDCAHGASRWAYSVGFTDYQYGSIKGNVFKDTDFNGLIGDEDLPFENLELGIKKYALIDGEWVLNQPAGTEYFDIVLTDENGNYAFENLDIYNEINGKNALCGYDIYVVNTPEGYTVTKYQKNNGIGDSSALLSNRIIKSKTNLDEMMNGKLVLADKNETGVNHIYLIDGYDIVHAHNLDNYNAGYAELRKGIISGTVFDDENYNAVLEDADGRIQNAELTLKRFVYDNNQWVEDTAYVNTVTTDENGEYSFENLDTYISDNGVNKLYGYEVWVTGAPDGYAITRYLNDSYVLLSGQIIKPDGTLSEILGGKIVVASVAEEDSSGVDPSFLIEGYDVILASAVENYNAGYKKEEKGTITGTVFDDKDYDGTLEEEDGRIQNAEVTLKRFVYDNNQWVEDTAYVNTVTTDENGEYSFENLDTYISDNGVNKLYGYEVWVTGAPDGYAITRYLNDSYVLLNGQIIKPDGTLPEMLGGKIVVASVAENKDGVDPSFLVENYNVVFAETLEDYNAGYKAQEKGTITGTVFDDKDYDGIFDEEDGLLSDVGITLKRFIYDNEQWIEDTKYINAAVTDKYGRYSFENLETHTVTDGENKLYGYEIWVTGAPDGYAITKNINDSYILPDGQIIKPNSRLPEMLAGKLVVASVADDIKGVDESFIIEDYNIVLAEALTDYNGGYTVIEKGSITGNIFDDMNYNGILDENDTLLQNIQIGLKRFVYENESWIPAKADGEEFWQITETDENGSYIFENLETFTSDENGYKLYGYQLYVIGMDNRFTTKYLENSGESDSALLTDTYEIVKLDSGLTELFEDCLVFAEYAKGQKDKNTPYIVEDFDIVKAVNLVQYNAGFVPEREYSISGNIWNDINRDGIMNEDIFMGGIAVTLERLYLKDGEWLALEPEDDDTPEPEAFIAESDNEAETDTDTDTDADISEDKEEVNPDIAVTDENGYYSFNHLPIYGEVDGETVVFAYSVKIDALPAQYAVTLLHEDTQDGENEMVHIGIFAQNEDSETPSEENGSSDEADDEDEISVSNNDLNDKTGYLEGEDKIIILAEEADASTPESYVVDGFNISYGNSVEMLDAGLVPYGTGSIGGILFEDANGNGIFDEGELTFEGETVYLDYFLAEEEDAFDKQNTNPTDETENGEFVSYQNMKAATDENGSFLFENLPVLNEKNQPYQYRLRTQKPAEREFTKNYAFEILSEEKVNILTGESEETETSSDIGTTPSISLAVDREDENFYNLEYQLDGYKHTNAYLAYAAIEKSDAVDTGTDNHNQWMIAVPIISLGMGLILIIGKKRRKETN